MQPVILKTPRQRAYAKGLIDKAPEGAVLTIRAATRSLEQNAKLWAMLSDIAMARPEGREHRPEIWKSIFMNALGHQVDFVHGLEGEIFPIGFRSSKLSVGQMADLITFIQQKGDEWGVVWSNEARGIQ